MKRVVSLACAVLLAGCTGLPSTLNGLSKDGTAGAIATAVGTGIVRGKLLGVDGTPASGVPIQAYLTQQAALSQQAAYKTQSVVRYTTQSTAPVASGNTDASGNFVLTNVPTGSISVEADKSDDQKALKMNLAVVAGQTIDMGNFSLAYTGAIHGHVAFTVNPAGGALGTDVFIPGTNFDAKTDANGDYTIVYVPQGTFPLVATYPGYLPASTDSVVVKPQQTTTAPSLTLGVNGGSFTGQALLQDRTDSSGITVTLTLNTSSATQVTGTTATDGTFTLPHVPAGTYTATFTKAPYFSQSQSNITISNGSNYALSQAVALSLSKAVTLGVQLYGGMPVPSPTSQTIAYVSGNSLAIQNIDGSPIPVYQFPNAVSNPQLAWSPDGKKLAVSIAGNATTYTLFDVTNPSNPVVHTLGTNGGLGWSPDSSSVAGVITQVSNGIWSYNDVGIYPFATGASSTDISVLASNTGSMQGATPVFSPDGTKVACYAQSSSTSQYVIFTQSVSGGAYVTVATESFTPTNLTWDAAGHGVYYGVPNNSGTVDVKYATSGVVPTVALAGLPYNGFAIAQDRVHVAYLQGIGLGLNELNVMNLSNRQTATVVKGHTSQDNINSLASYCWMANGGGILYQTNQSNSLFVATASALIDLP